MSKILKVKVTKVDATPVVDQPGKYKNFTGHIRYGDVIANVERATFELLPNEEIIWQSGVWSDGQWRGGTWFNGTWRDGSWKKGIWVTGKWENGWFMDGTWKSGDWNDGTWTGRLWLDKKNKRPDLR